MSFFVFTLPLWAILASAVPQQYPQPLKVRSLETTNSDTAPTFYIVDKTPNNPDNGYQANVMTNPPGVYFGTGWDDPMVFNIDPSTGYLVTADPKQTVWSAFIEDEGEGLSRLQFGIPSDGGEQHFVSCNIDSEKELTCSADGGRTEFLLDGSTAGSSAYRLHLVEPGKTTAYGHTATLGVEYAPPPVPSIPPKFYITTDAGYAVHFGADSAVYAGIDFAKETPGSIFSFDQQTGHLVATTDAAGPNNDDEANPNVVAVIDMTTTTTTTSPSGYGQVRLSRLPLSSLPKTIKPLVCNLDLGPSDAITCKAEGGYEAFWLDQGENRNPDYTLYLATAESQGNGTNRIAANTKYAECVTCS